MNAMQPARQYYQIVSDLMRDCLLNQQEVFSVLAERMAQTIRNSGHIYIFGSGHSSLLAQSAQLRGGGLTGVIPILATNLMVHENPQLSSLLERTPGLAKTILERYAIAAGDILFVISNSGVNAVPVEMAALAKKKGLTVVTICAKAYAATAQSAYRGERLVDLADFVLDNGSQKGDAVLVLPDSCGSVCPTSSLMNEFIWQCLVAECSHQLAQQIDPMPIYKSLNLEGAGAHNDQFIQQMRLVNPHL